MLVEGLVLVEHGGTEPAWRLLNVDIVVLRGVLLQDYVGPVLRSVHCLLLRVCLAEQGRVLARELLLMTWEEVLRRHPWVRARRVVRRAAGGTAEGEKVVHLLSMLLLCGMYRLALFHCCGVCRVMSVTADLRASRNGSHHDFFIHHDLHVAALFRVLLILDHTIEQSFLNLLARGRATAHDFLDHYEVIVALLRRVRQISPG